MEENPLANEAQSERSWLLPPPTYAKASVGEPSYLAYEAWNKRSWPLKLRTAGHRLVSSNIGNEIEPTLAREEQNAKESIS